ncbi:MAG: type I methionyl aminopeptidase [Oscillospiraceae bacterium]|jgi:methionyl aminopeptidase|nr:type I methionyl aminopeptidase [Oscillospiraceae bacterium]
MIVLKTTKELDLMKKACALSARVLRLAGEMVEPGVTTGAIDKRVREWFAKAGATPVFLHYNGFPAAACISINNEVIHGIPSPKRVIQPGDLVSIDLGAKLNGYIGDNAATFAAGDISPEAKRLSDTTREALYVGIRAACTGGRVGDIGAAVQSYCEARGYSLVRDYTGHGVGRELHEDPSVPNFGTPGRGARLLPGMTIAIEPMVNQGKKEIRTLEDNWTVRTRDGSLSAHFEHTIAITANGPVILTVED